MGWQSAEYLEYLQVKDITFVHGVFSHLRFYILDGETGYWYFFLHGLCELVVPPIGWNASAFSLRRVMEGC